ncbi:MAG: AMP-binding protein [Planctomycetaceae bacterium]
MLIFPGIACQIKQWGWKRDPVLPDSLKTILIGGEKCPDSVIQRFAHRIRLINSYGPTETTVCSSMNLCRGERGESAIIGKPLNHVTYLIDEANDNELLIGDPALQEDIAIALS